MFPARKIPNLICNAKSFPLQKLSLVFALILSTIATISLGQTGARINEEGAQYMWGEYYERIKRRRLGEADLLWSAMRSNGVSDETVLAMDFMIFCGDEVGAKRVAQQLSENYTTSLRHDLREGVWFVDGTTRPTGLTISKEEHSNWVGFMSDVSAQYGCVFASWTLETPKLDLVFTSETLETNLP